jgi:hypothetical protein
VHARELGNERLVGIRVGAAQPMIEVRREENDAEFIAKFQQHA